jgi:aminopeptidase N
LPRVGTRPIIPDRVKRSASAIPILLVLNAAARAAEPDVVDYQVELSIDRTQRTIRGTERIRVRSAGGPLEALVFPRNGIELLSAQVAGVPVDHRVTAETIELRLPRPINGARTATVALSYVARAPKGVTWDDDHVHTAFFTCHWMICREEPADRATLTLTLAVPQGLAVVASGEPTRRRPRPDGLVDHVWREARPYPSYLFGFALGSFTPSVERRRDVILESYAPGSDAPVLARMLEGTGEMIDFFEARAGLPLPHRHYRQVVVAGSEAQEATSFSLLGRKHLELRLSTPDEDWVIAHELAHQYWGNLLTCADWTHFWLNEGLTVFMVAAWKEQRWGRAAYDRELGLARTRHQVAVAAGFDVPLTFAGAFPSPRVRRAIVYSKGALFVATLRETMGDRAFWAALRSYTRRFAGRSVTSADFQRIFQAATPTDLAPLFATWVSATPL